MNNPSFTGVWLPAEIMLDKNLKAIDKILYAEIASFGSNGCYKKSEELQEMLGVKADAFQASCRRLRELGYISERRNFGRMVRTTTLGFNNNANKAPKTNETPQNEQEVEKTTKRAKSAEISRNSSNSETAVEVKTENPEDYEARKNKGIDMMFKYWEQEMGFGQKQSKANRFACYNLLRAKDKGKKWIAEMIVYLKLAKSDRYSGIKINNFADLQRDWEKLYGWASSKKAQIESAVIVAGDSDFDDLLK